MTCKECKFGKYDKKTNTVHCRLLDRTLIMDRAYNCKNYEDSTLIKNLKAKGKLNG
jgi:hypothetical protein